MRNKLLAGFIVFMTIALTWLGISATGPVSSGVSVDPSTLVLTYPTNLWLTNANGIWIAISNYVVATSAPTNALLRNNNLADVANQSNSLANLNGLPNNGGTGTNETFTGTNTFTGPIVGQSNISAQTLSVSGAQTLSQINTPATPSAGHVAVYAKNSAGVAKLFYLQPDGLEIGPLSIGGSGGSATNAITSMNGLTNPSQSIIVGTAGNDFAINSSGQTHEFDLPDASGTARGALTSADYKRIGFTNVANTWIPPQTFSTNVIVNGQIEVADGTASKPGISFSSDTSLGIRPQSAGSLGIYSGGVSLYNFDATKFGPQTDGTRDLGGSANQFRDGYFSRNVAIGNNLTVSGTNTINNETFSQRIQPLIGITYDLGSATAQWNKIWTANESIASTLTANQVAVTNGLTAKTLSVSGSPLLFSEQYGKNASATNTDALAVGYNSSATGTDSTALGAAAQATGNSSVALGAASGAAANGAVAVGVGAVATGTNAVAIGGNSLAGHLNSVALAENAVTTRTNQIVLGDSSFQTLIAGQLQANGSNIFNGPVRMVGRRQFPWVSLGSTTIDGTTNHLTSILTTNSTWNWTGVDGDDVLVEVIQDGTGGRTLAINNVDVWVSSTNQSTSMPLVNTNANFYSYVHLWRKGTTDFGTVSTAPSPWEVDWASQNATSAQVAAAVTDESGTGKLLFGNPGGQTNGQALVWNAVAGTWTNGAPSGGGGTPGAPASSFQFSSNGIAFGGASGVLWTPPFITLSNSSSADMLLFRNASFGTNVFSYKWSIGYPSAEFILHEYSPDLSASNIAFGISGGKGSGLVQAHAYGHMLVDSNLYVSGIQTNTGALVQNGAASFGSSVTHNGPVVNASTNTTNVVINGVGPPVRVYNLTNNLTFTSTNEVNYSSIRVVTIQGPGGTNTVTWNLTKPTVFRDGTNQAVAPYMPTNAGTILTWDIVDMGATNLIIGPDGVASPNLSAVANWPLTNGMAFGVLNGSVGLIPVGSGSGGGSGNIFTNPTFYAPIQVPIGPDSTNIDWLATSTYQMQGFTASGDFTNLFQNAPPNAGSQLTYVVNNTTAAKTNINCWLGPSGTANAITNNFWQDFNTQTNVVICPPGLTTFEWGYNGSVYYFTTKGQNHIRDQGTNLLAGLDVAVNGSISPTNTIRLASGTLSKPSIVFAVDDDANGVGWYRNAADTWGFGVNGSLKYYFDNQGISTVSSTPLRLGEGNVILSGATVNYLFLGYDAFTAPIYTVQIGGSGVGTDRPGGGGIINPGHPTGTGAIPAIQIGVATNATGTGSGAMNYGTPVTPGGTLKVDTTTTGNVGAGEDNLITYAVPGAELGKNGDFLEFDVWGSFAANANTKDLKVYFGAAVIIDTTALVLNGLDWRAHGKIVRTGAATQTATTELTIGGTLLSALNGTIVKTSAPTETLSANVTFKCTGTDSGGVPVDNSIVQNGMVIKWYRGQ